MTQPHLRPFIRFFLHPVSNSKCFTTLRHHYSLDFDAVLMQFERQSVYTSNCETWTREATWTAAPRLWDQICFIFLLFFSSILILFYLSTSLRRRLQPCMITAHSKHCMITSYLFYKQHPFKQYKQAETESSHRSIFRSCMRVLVFELVTDHIESKLREIKSCMTNDSPIQVQVLYNISYRSVSLK
jgi:hypothetical protein